MLRANSELKVYLVELCIFSYLTNTLGYGVEITIAFSVVAKS